jgi:two-component system phosphate regulon sensor histidine kinase PhoR
MFERRSLRWPITLGVVMFIVLAALLVGWVLLNIFGIRFDAPRAGLYIALLSIGATLLTLAIVGTALYLTLTIKAINLTRRQSNFIDSVTHELKSPVTSLKLYLQTLNRRPVSAAEQELFFKDMLEDVERLDTLISHLLTSPAWKKTAWARRRRICDSTKSSAVARRRCASAISGRARRSSSTWRPRLSVRPASIWS